MRTATERSDASSARKVGPHTGIADVPCAGMASPPWVMNARVQRLNKDSKTMLQETLPCVERDLSHLVTKEHH
mgnify:CR=1 FL=1